MKPTIPLHLGHHKQREREKQDGNAPATGMMAKPNRGIWEAVQDGVKESRLFPILVGGWPVVPICFGNTIASIKTHAYQKRISLSPYC